MEEVLKMIKNKMKDLREAYGLSLVKLAKKEKRIVVLDADVARPTGIHIFAEKFPERFFEMGVAEQNMIGVAAGLASCGFIPFPTTLGVFASKRAHDQVSICVAYSNLNVKVVGSYSGLTSFDAGATHQAIDDIASMRAMPNMTIVVPADAIEVEKAVFAIAKKPGPVYLRIAKYKPPMIFNRDYQFRLGQAVVLREGLDITLIGTGIMTSKCLRAAVLLQKDKIEATVLHVHTIKPIDAPKIIEAAKKTRVVVTAENHSIIGGLGSAVSEVLGENEPCIIQRIGIKDSFGESAEDEESLFKKYGLTTGDIVEISKKVLRFKERR